MSKSSRLKAPSLLNRIEFERCIDDLARTTVTLRQLEARRDEALQLVRAKHEPAIGEAAARVEGLTLLAEKYALEHRADLLPGKIKSATTALAEWGYRFGNPALRLLNRSWTWDKVLRELQRRRFRRWIRTKHEPAKDLMLAAGKRSKRAEAALLAIGVKVDQTEAFYVEPKEQPGAEARAS
jgi:phage host-nuclease inhibitor protein Gam